MSVFVARRPHGRPATPGLGKRLALGMAAVALLSGCRGEPTATPRSVAETVVAALDKGDVARFLAVLPTEDRLGEVFDCGRADTLRAALRRRLDDVPAEFEARKRANFRVRLIAFDGPGSESVELAPGDVFHGCTARVAVAVHRSRVTVSRTRGGRLEETDETWTFLQFDPEGPWSYGKY